MADLIARLQMAFGPDRNLDGSIAVATTKTVRSSDDLVYARERDRKGGDATRPGDCFMVSRSGASARTAANFTASVDAALTLIPEGYDWLIGKGQTRPDEPPFGVQIFLPSSGRMVAMPPPLAEGEHPEMAIAICIAALGARVAIAKAMGAA